MIVSVCLFAVIGSRRVYAMLLCIHSINKTSLASIIQCALQFGAHVSHDLNCSEFNGAMEPIISKATGKGMKSVCPTLIQHPK